MYKYKNCKKCGKYNGTSFKLCKDCRGIAKRIMRKLRK